MKVIDLRKKEAAALFWADLVAGHVYLADDGTILMATDEDRYVQLSGDDNGALYGWNSFDNGDATTFEKLDAELIIR